MVCDTKENGGLGALNLRTQNESLLLKNLHKFFNRADLPSIKLIWNQYYQHGRLPIPGSRRGSFRWKDSVSLLETYKGLAFAVVRNGNSIKFWLDVWDNHFLSVQWPQLFYFVRNQNITVQQISNNSSVQELFYLPLSEEAFQQFQEYNDLIDGLQLSEEPDIWTYIWGSTIFTPSRAYHHLIGSR